jgi:TatD DNase family protein
VIDLHCHLDLYPDPNAIVIQCERRRLYVLSVTNVPSAWTRTSALSRGDSRIKTSLGLHPQLAKERKGELAMFEAFLPATRYVGEVGLDGSPQFADSWEDQVYVFECILALCRRANGKIISIHSRRAATAVLDRIERDGGCGVPVLHWFSGSLRELTRAIDLGCWFSVGPAMLASSKGRKLFENMPRDRVITESDGPFASVGGRALFPWDVNGAFPTMSDMWNLSLAHTKAQLLANLRALTTAGPGNPDA